jgi:C-terminal processing protease CtpA/Prc
VQVFDNTPAARDGSLEAGDELTSVNRVSVKGKSKAEVAKMIQANRHESVVIQYNKLHADPKLGKSLDIILKKVTHFHHSDDSNASLFCSANTHW